MSWFKEVYGEEPTEVVEAYPPLNITENEPVEVEFLEDHPRVVKTAYGTRAVINVKHKGETFSLWLSRKGLARAIAALERQVESMKGKKARIQCLGRTGRLYRYTAEWITKAPTAKTIREKAKE